MFTKYKNVFLKLLLLTVSVVFVAGIFFAKPKKAEATGVFVFGSVELVFEKVVKALEEFLSVTVIRAAASGAQILAQNLAYDAAIWVTSGDKGQRPLLNVESAGEFFQKAAEIAGGEVIGSINEDLGANFNICEPTSPKVTLAFKLGLTQAIQPQAPRCDFKKFVDNWEQFGNQITSNPREFLNNVQLSFNPSSSEIGAFLDVNGQAIGNVQAGIRSRNADRGVLDASYRDVRDLVSKRVETPRSLVQARVERSLFAADKKADQDNLMLQIAGVVRPQSAGALIASTFTTTFANTVGSELTKKLMTGLWGVGDLVFGGTIESSTAGRVYGGRANARLAFSELLNTDINNEVTNYDYLTEFTTCPIQDGVKPSVNNCTINDSFARAIRVYNLEGKGMSVQEAVNAGLLNGGWQLLSANNAAVFNQDDCYANAFCEHNLAKLRRARIIPVGWEFAARICDSDSMYRGACASFPEITLSLAMNNYRTCHPDVNEEARLARPAAFTQALQSKPEYMFCNLVDPNWILKAPETMCKSEVNGSQILAGGLSDRDAVCVDDVSCVAYNADGTCADYGYCTREKNVWKFEGESCPAQFASCEVFSPRDGGDSLALLSDTIDAAGCEEGNAGCLWYAKGKTSTGDWDIEDRIYLNGKAQDCDSDSAGCRELIEIGQNNGTNLLYNGGFEVDQEGNKLPTGWKVQNNAQLDANAFAGQGAAQLGQSGAQVTSPTVNIVKDGDYTFSFFATQSQPGGSGNFVVLDGSKTLLSKNFKPSAVNSYDQFIYTLENIDARSITIRFEQANGGVRVDNASVTYGLAVPNGYNEYGDVNTTHLKIASADLGCYENWLSFDSGTCISKGGLWNGRTCEAPAVCTNFAPWCTEAEVGCMEFTPRNGIPVSLTGTPQSRDFCPNSCAGYSSFSQSATAFEDAVFPQYFIPSSAQQCSAEASGCDAFTSLDSLQSGTGEQKAYFTEIQTCQKVDGSCRTFYTWESQDTTGFQLKSYNFVADLSNPAQIKPKFFGTGTDRCDEALFKSQKDPNCRQFYFVDDAGQTIISYRTITQARVCSNQCTPFRHDTIQVESTCIAKGGTWTNNACVFNVLVSGSQQCSAAENGCRAYVGNTGNNIRQIFNHTFENGTNEGWQGGVNSKVATNIYGNSLQNANDQILSYDVTGEVVAGGQYLFSVWMKAATGTTQNVTAQFRLTDSSGISTTGNMGKTVAVGDSWNLYRFDPSEFFAKGAAVPQKIEIALSGAQKSALYIDNARFDSIGDSYYAIKNSWTTPIQCDNTLDQPNGAGGATQPTRDTMQAQLGCQEYVDSNGQSVFLKQMSKSCRDGAVGCKAFVDTKQSPSALQEVYNAYCEVGVTGQRQTVQSTGYDQCVHNVSGVSCILEPGAKGCYVDYVGQPELFLGQGGTNIFGVRAQITSASGIQLSNDHKQRLQERVIVPADSLLYVVDNGSHQCSSGVAGCQEIGLPTLAADGTLDASVPADQRWKSVYKINAPKSYDSILCGTTGLFCKEFKTEKGTTKYFKQNTQNLCEYRENVNINGAVLTGWFKKSNPEEPCYSDVVKSDGSAVLGSDLGDHIVGDVDVIGVQSNYLVKADSDAYKGFTGMCTPDVNQCTQFVDPLGSSQTGSKNYYLINDDQLNSDECTGVSQAEGCVLVNDTSKSALTFDSAKSYENSELNRQRQVPAIKGDATTADTNRILKVVRDRMCGEWLTCKSRSFQKDKDGNNMEICTQLVSCRSYDDAVGTTKCREIRPAERQQLTLGNYQQRGVDYLPQRTGTTAPVAPQGSASGAGTQVVPKPTLAGGSNIFNGLSQSNSTNSSVIKNLVTWNTLDYSGYSIPDLYPIEYFKSALSYHKDSNGFVTEKANLVYDTGAKNAAGRYAGSCTVDSDCAETFTANGQQFTPSCISNMCVINIDGTKITTDSYTADGKTVTQVDAPKNLGPNEACRAYPEADSPFPFSTNYSTLFERANLCANSTIETAGSKTIATQNTSCVDSNGCHYVKQPYGNDGEYELFVGPDVKTADLPQGICDSGKFEGQACTTTVQCNPDDKQGGTARCLPKDNRSFKYTGWEGFCLEKSRGASYREADYDFPCLTWMPVRHMAGLKGTQSRDLEAGFYAADATYCAETSVFKDVGRSTLQCSADPNPGQDGNSDTDVAKCAEVITCPDRHFVVMGPPNSWGSNRGGTASQRNESGFCAYGDRNAFNDGDTCPYMCIPMGSKLAQVPVLGGTSAKEVINSEVSMGSNQTFKLNTTSCWDMAKGLADRFPVAQNSLSKYGVATFGKAGDQKYPQKDMWYVVMDDLPSRQSGPLAMQGRLQTNKQKDISNIFDFCRLDDIDLLDGPHQGLYGANTGETGLACKVSVTVQDSKGRNAAQTALVANANGNPELFADPEKYGIQDLTMNRIGYDYASAGQKSLPFGGYTNNTTIPFLNGCTNPDVSIVALSTYDAKNKKFVCPTDAPNVVGPNKPYSLGFQYKKIAFGAAPGLVGKSCDPARADSQCTNTCDFSTGTLSTITCNTDADCRPNAQVNLGQCMASGSKKICSQATTLASLPNSQCSGGNCFAVSCSTNSDCNRFGGVCGSNKQCTGTAFSSQQTYTKLGACTATGTACSTNEQCKAEYSGYDSQTCTAIWADPNDTSATRAEVVQVKSDGSSDYRCVYKDTSLRNGRYSIIEEEKPEVAYDRLKQLFAKVYQTTSLIVSYPTEDIKVLASTQPDLPRGTPFVRKDLGLLGNWDNRATSQVRPRISIPTVSNATLEDNNFFNLNGQRTGVVEVYEGTLVTASFYAWADSNQLPLKRVGVRWSDTIVSGDIGVLSTEPEGFYKNRRAICNVTEQKSDIGQTIPAKGYGGSEFACETGLFEFDHVYIPRDGERNFSCAALGPDARSGFGKPVNTRAFGAVEREYCEIIPRVYVEDNWGKCLGSADNAECTAGRGYFTNQTIRIYKK